MTVSARSGIDECEAGNSDQNSDAMITVTNGAPRLLKVCRLFPRRWTCFLLTLGLSFLAMMMTAFLFPATPYQLLVSPLIDVGSPNAKPWPVSRWVVLCLDDDVTPLDWADLPPDWRAIVLAKARPRGCSLPSCLYLSDQPDFMLRDDKCHLSATAKMAAYLYAMMQGATAILVGRPEVPVRDWLKGFHMTSSMPGLVFTGSTIFDPEVHFGFWKEASSKPLQYNISDVTHPFLQHRLTWPNESDAKAQDVVYLPSVMMGRETYSPFALTETLFLYEGLWALPFSVFFEGTVKGGGGEKREEEQLEAEYAASLIVQRLLQELHAHVAFLAPARAFAESPIQAMTSPHQNRSSGALRTKSATRPLKLRTARNVAGPGSTGKLSKLRPRSGQKNTTASHPMPSSEELLPRLLSKGQAPQSSRMTQATKSEASAGNVRIVKLLDFLRRWQCATFETFRTCVEQLISVMAGRFVSLEMVASVHRNLRQMADLGYVFPLRFVPGKTNYRPLTSALYAPPTGEEPWRELKPFRTSCPHLPDLPPQPPIITDIVLIVTFNYVDLYRNIPYLKSLYRPFFRHIVFCGPNVTNFRLHAQEHVHGDGFLYTLGLTRGWYFMYECILYAMLMNPHARGYLQIGDDTLVNSWQIASLPRHKVWLPFPRQERNIDESWSGGWMWWNSNMGRQVLKKVFDELNSLVEKPPSLKMHNLAMDVRNTFYTNAKSLRRVFFRGTDFFYIPDRVREKFIFLSKLNIKYGVMNELALINIVLGLDLIENVHFFSPDGSLWYNGERSYYDKLYNSSLLFLHPFKASALKGEKGQHFFCNNYMIHFMKHLTAYFH